MFKKIVQFSHNDLDGYACNVVSQAISFFLRSEGYGDIPVEIHNCDYASIDSVIHSRLVTTLNHEFDDTLFVVSDISWKSNYITEVFKNTKWFIFADHHRSSEALGKELARCDRHGYRCSVSKEGDECGALQLFRCFEEILFDNRINLFPRWNEELNRLADFLDIVNRWDLWTWASEVNAINKTNAYTLLNHKAPCLNAYLDFFLQGVTGENAHKFAGHMIDLIVNPIECDFDTDLCRLMSDTNGFAEYLRNQARMIENTCNHYQRVPLPMPIGPDIEALVFLCPVGITNKSLVSILASNKLRDCGVTDYDCLLIHEIGSDTASLRYPTSEDIDLSFVAKYNYLAKDNTGGGHPFAAGFPIDGDMFVDNLLINKKLWRL